MLPCPWRIEDAIEILSAEVVVQEVFHTLVVPDRRAQAGVMRVPEADALDEVADHV